MKLPIEKSKDPWKKGKNTKLKYKKGDKITINTFGYRWKGEVLDSTPDGRVKVLVPTQLGVERYPLWFDPDEIEVI